MKNIVTDVSGIKVGQAEDPALMSGVTVIVFDEPATASVDVRGGAPGTRETDLLQPGRTVEKIDAVVFSGGSAFGLSAADGVMAMLREQGRGFKVGKIHVPIVPSAIIYDLKDGDIWERYPPYRELSYEAAKAASTNFRLGSFCAGCGATTASGKGGTGSASAKTSFGAIVGALAIVNAFGAANFRGSNCFFAGALEQDNEFGGYGLPSPITDDMMQPQTKVSSLRANTTLGLVVTDAKLTKLQCHNLAVKAQEGLKLALSPVHTLHDGDAVFAASTGLLKVTLNNAEVEELEKLASETLARAIARGVYEANI